MKKIKFLMMAAVALFSAMTFTACSDDSDVSPKQRGEVGVEFLGPFV